MNREQKIKKTKVSVALLVMPETTAAILFCMKDILGSVGNVWSAVTGEDEISVGFDVKTVSIANGNDECYGGIPIIIDDEITKNTSYDVVIIPDFMVNNDVAFSNAWREYADWLTRRHKDGSIVCSVCTGSALLAYSGLLDGKQATSHWSVLSALRELYPLVHWRIDENLVLADADHKMITSGGFSTWAELALYIIKRFFGHAEATRMAKMYLLGSLEDGQLPFAALTSVKKHDDRAIEICQEWIAVNYAQSNPVSELVALSGLPSRTFKRRFKKATDFTPVQYIQTMRIEEAKQYLETTSLNVDEIAAIVGYEDPAFFRRLFRRLAGIPPAKYRQKFQSIGKIDV